MPTPKGYSKVASDEVNPSNTSAVAAKVSARKGGMSSPGSPLDHGAREYGDPHKSKRNNSATSAMTHDSESETVSFQRAPPTSSSTMALKLDRMGSGFSPVNEEDKSVSAYDEYSSDPDFAFGDLGGGAALVAPGATTLTGAFRPKEYSMSDRFFYKLENTIASNHNVPYYILVFFAFVFVIGTAALWINVSHGDPDHPLAQDFHSATFMAVQMLFTGGADTSYLWLSERYVFGLAMVSGVLLTSVLVGLVTESVQDYMSSLKDGKSLVIESGHTLILGHSDKLLPVIRQLSLANESEGGGCVVVLLESGSVQELRDEINTMKSELDGGLRGTRVVVRIGNPCVMDHLLKVAVEKAKAILVLSMGTAAASDARAMRIVLGLVNGLGPRLTAHVTVEMSDVDSEPLVNMVGDGHIETIVAHEVLGRLMIQCARQPGLARVWENLLGFDGSEFYLEQWPALVGKTFGEISFMFRDAVPIGLRRASENMKVELNPPDGLLFGAGDELVVLAEDDDTYAPSATPHTVSDSLMKSWRPSRPLPPKPERILFVGWRRDMDSLLSALNSWVAKGSELTIFCPLSVEEREARFEDEEFDPDSVGNLTIIHRVGDPTLRRHLVKLPLNKYQWMLVLANEDSEVEGTLAADSASLATLLIIRDLQENLAVATADAVVANAGSGPGALAVSPQARSAAARVNCAVVAEILDGRTKGLIGASVGDPVLSNDVVSMAMAMVAENRHVNTILKELFGHQGVQCFLRPLGAYMKPDGSEELSFWDVAARCRSAGELLVGFRPFGDPNPTMNPPNKATARQWHPKDVLVVLATETQASSSS